MGLRLVLIFYVCLLIRRDFPGGSVVKKPPANAGDVRVVDSFSGLGRSPGGGHGNPLQCSCLDNPMDRGAWGVTVHEVAKRQTRLRDSTERKIICC